MKQETLQEVAERLYPTTMVSIFTQRDKVDKNKERRKLFIEGAEWQQELGQKVGYSVQVERMYSEEEVNKMFDTLKRNSIDNVATISNVDLFINSWKKQFKKK